MHAQFEVKVTPPPPSSLHFGDHAASTDIIMLSIKLCVHVHPVVWIAVMFICSFSNTQISGEGETKCNALQ